MKWWEVIRLNVNMMRAYGDDANSRSVINLQITSTEKHFGECSYFKGGPCIAYSEGEHKMLNLKYETHRKCYVD